MPLSYYRRVLKIILASLFPIMETLYDGLWLSSMFGPAIEDEFS
jgi:hypothetical protein